MFLFYFIYLQSTSAISNTRYLELSLYRTFYLVPSTFSLTFFINPFCKRTPYLNFSLCQKNFSVPSVIFGLFPIHYLEHSNEVFEWIILFISGTWMLITALKKFVRVFFSFFSTSFRHQHVSAKQKLDVKILAEKYQALRDLKKGPQTKTFVKKYDLPCCEDKFYCNYKRIKYFAELVLF